MLSFTCVPSSKFLDVSIQPRVAAGTREMQRDWEVGQQDIGDMKREKSNVEGFNEGREDNIEKEGERGT